MNLPNKLTMSRLLFVVVICVLYYVLPKTNILMYVLLGLFALASFTDFLDGKIARKHNLVTGFGKLMDPLADKMLVITSIILLIDFGIIKYPWLLIIVVARELFVLGIRLIALEEGSGAIAADIFGKIKTFTQMISLCLLFLYGALSFDFDNVFINIIYYVGIVLFYISVAFTLFSGIEIFVKNKKYFKIK